MGPLLNLDLRDFFVRLYNKSVSADIFSRAAQTAFYFSFSLFPLLFFLVSLFGIVLDSTDALKAEVFSYLRQIMPMTAFDLVKRTVEEIIVNSSGSKLTVGLIVTLWSASAGVDAVRGALNAVYQLSERRPWWRTKLESLVLTFVVTVLSAFVLTIVFYGLQLVELISVKLGFPVTSPFILISIQWISILLVMLFVFELIFNLLPDFRIPKWIWITPGSIVAIVLWLLLSGSFRLYISYFNSYDRAYGSLGAVIILMFWLYLTAVVLMVGGVINSVLADMEVIDDETIE